MTFKRFALLLFIIAVVGGGARADVRPAGVFQRETQGGVLSEETSTPAVPAAPAASRVVRPTRDLSKFEGRTVESVEVTIEEAGSDEAALAEFRTLLRVAAGGRLSAVLVRESLQELFDSGRVANARVEAFDAPGEGADGRPRVRLRFVIRPQVFIAAVRIELGDVAPGAPISEDELRARLNLVEPGKRVSEQAIRNNADMIQVYLRDRGFYQANVEYEQQLDPTRTRSTVTYRIALGAQATVSDLNIGIKGFEPSAVLTELKLRPGAPFTQTTLGEDINRIRQAIIKQGYLAPRIDEPRIQLDSVSNKIIVSVTGAIGPKVEVSVTPDPEVTGFKLSDERARELLPVTREGTIDASAIVEGQRRLQNRLQEQGYFFIKVNPVCTVTPPLPVVQPTNGNGTTTTALPEDVTASTCDGLNPEELSGRNVRINYVVTGDNPAEKRRYELTDIRIVNADGTPARLSVEEVADDLRTRKANALGFIPFFGLGRGFTSEQALEQDTRTITARMRDLGYRRAAVTERRGLSLEGDNLIITFVVDEGALTRVAGVEMRGNQLFTAERLREAACPADRSPDEACTIIDAPYSRTQARIDADRIRNFYARNGYLDAEVNIALVELPEGGGDERVRLVYNIAEADKVFVHRIFINGNAVTDRKAILEAIPLREGEVLRTDNITEAERNLYATDAFRQVIIRTEPAGETASGFKQRDVIIDLEERKRYVMDYGGGYSTDNGPLGLYEIRNSNLFGALRQGALRMRGSRRQQLLRLEYFDPRFRRYGERAFSPFVVSAQYQRDTTVTRFFRSTIDRGNFGIVQRLNEEGNPIDVDCPLPDPQCEVVGAPTINRFTINAETQRDIELELGPRGQVLKRSTLFVRYNYEDVRLYNIQSLLIASILRPDRAVRLSRFGVTFARDSRDKALDATRGDFLTLDYALALKQFGGNLSFSKLLLNYRRYYQVPKARGTVLAAGVQLGLASLYDPSDRGGTPGVIDDIDLTLPISERFFSGGSTTLRGFGSEEAGPRVVVPGGVFRNNEGEQVTISPFTVPVGGNALAVVNLEARIAAIKNLQVVPFYDGGNVFRRIGDIFGRDVKPGEDPNLRARWTHTVGLGLRLRTPFGPLAVDYGFLLNPPEFVLPQANGDPARFRLKRGQIHFRFGQTF
ncbi:MAG TPA: POTRA domain-containing protein [Pyrinomonadaceae bacterium]